MLQSHKVSPWRLCLHIFSNEFCFDNSGVRVSLHASQLIVRNTYYLSPAQITGKLNILIFFLFPSCNSMVYHQKNFKQMMIYLAFSLCWLLAQTHATRYIRIFSSPNFFYTYWIQWYILYWGFIGNSLSTFEVGVSLSTLYPRQIPLCEIILDMLLLRWVI